MNLRIEIVGNEAATSILWPVSLHGIKNQIKINFSIKLLTRFHFDFRHTHTDTHHRDEIISNYFERKPKKLLKNKQKFVIDGIH